MQTPSVLNQQTEASCAGLAGNALHECLQDLLGEQDPIRSVKEILVRSFAIQIVVLGSYGHLLSLQGITKFRSPHVYLSPLIFFVFPEMAVAQILNRILQMTVRALKMNEHVGVRHFLAACLGMHATASDGTIPLVKLAPQDVNYEAKELSLVWLGRLGLIVSLLAQHVGSCILWVRLVFWLKDRSYWHWHVDFRNFELVLGGAVAVLTSFGIFLLGHGEWTVVAESNSVDDVAEEPTISDYEKSETAPVNEEAPHLSMLQRLRKKNRLFSHYLDQHFPRTLQYDLELAVVFHRILVHAVVVYTYRRFSGGCPTILNVLAKGKYATICPDHVNIYDPMTFSLIPSIRNSSRLAPWLFIPSTLFNIALVRIFLQWICSAILVVLQFSPWSQILQAVSRLEHWLLSGRSILSFPITLLLFSLVPFWIAMVAWHYGKVEVAFRSGKLEVADHMVMSLLMWKDPWYDTLYVL